MNKFLISMTYIVTVSFLPLAHGSLIVTDGLVAAYELNGNTNDSSGNHFDGVAHGASPTQDRFGNQRGAYSFNGINNYIELPTAAIGGWNELTLSVWVNAPEYNGNSWPPFFGSYAGNAAFNDNLGVWKNTDRLHFEIITTDGNFYGLGELEIPWDEWFHVALVYDGSTLTEYINGVQGKVVSASGTLLPTTELFLGKYHSDNTGFLNGSLDDAFIYNRALSTEEIGQLTNYSSVPEPTTLVLLGVALLGLGFTRQKTICR